MSPRSTKGIFFFSFLFVAMLVLSGCTNYDYKDLGFDVRPIEDLDQNELIKSLGYDPVLVKNRVRIELLGIESRFEGTNERMTFLAERDFERAQLQLAMSPQDVVTQYIWTKLLAANTLESDYIVLEDYLSKKMSEDQLKKGNKQYQLVKKKISDFNSRNPELLKDVYWRSATKLISKPSAKRISLTELELSLAGCADTEANISLPFSSESPIAQLLTYITYYPSVKSASDIPDALPFKKSVIRSGNEKSYLFCDSSTLEEPTGVSSYGLDGYGGMFKPAFGLDFDESLDEVKLSFVEVKKVESEAGYLQDHLSAVSSVYLKSNFVPVEHINIKLVVTDSLALSAVSNRVDTVYISTGLIRLAMMESLNSVEKELASLIKDYLAVNESKSLEQIKRNSDFNALFGRLKSLRNDVIDTYKRKFTFIFLHEISHIYNKNIWMDGDYHANEISADCSAYELQIKSEGHVELGVANNLFNRNLTKSYLQYWGYEMSSYSAIEAYKMIQSMQKRTQLFDDVSTLAADGVTAYCGFENLSTNKYFDIERLDIDSIMRSKYSSK